MSAPTTNISSFRHSVSGTRSASSPANIAVLTASLFIKTTSNCTFLPQGSDSSVLTILANVDLSSYWCIASSSVWSLPLSRRSAQTSPLLIADKSTTRDRQPTWWAAATWSRACIGTTAATALFSLHSPCQPCPRNARPAPSTSAADPRHCRVAPAASAHAWSRPETARSMLP